MNLLFPQSTAVLGLHAGLFIARRGMGVRHPTRIIDSHELILVRRGRLDLQESGKAFAVAANEILLLVAGRPHGGLVDYPPDLSFYWLHFQAMASSGETLSVPQHSTPRRATLLMAWMHRYLDDQSSGAATPATAGLLVQLMLAEIAAAPRAAGDDPAAHLVGRAEAWIGHHYQDSLSTRDIALALACNADYLGRVYRRITGKSIVTSIHERRLAEAKTHLINTTTDVESIARRVGFNDPVHFRRLFRRHNGCTPGAFRSLHARAFVNSD